MSELLAEDEKRALALTGELWGLFGKIVGNGRTRSADLGEVVLHVHALQHIVLAQAAGRAYPTEFRLLGSTLEDSDDRDA